MEKKEFVDIEDNITQNDKEWFEKNPNDNARTRTFIKLPSQIEQLKKLVNR